MKQIIICMTLLIFLFVPGIPVGAEGATRKVYTVGVDDILQVSLLQPDEIRKDVIVSPDGYISFPYIGSVKVEGKTLSQIQKTIEKRLANGYMKYPVVYVALTESRSRKFLVYGEVRNPGSYSIGKNTTVLEAISRAGGFIEFGSFVRVKVLRPKKGRAGYRMIKINIKKVMNGNSSQDLILKAGDMVVVSKGSF